MISRPVLTRGHLEAALTPGFLRSLGVIHAAIAMGPLLYFIVVLLISGTGGSDSTGLLSPDLLQVLTLATVVAFAVAAFAGKFFFQRIVEKAVTAEEQPNEPDRTTDRLLFALRTGHIVRQALLEGSAVFGLTVCLLGGKSVVTIHDPLFLVNCLPMAYFLGYAIVQFPTRERLVSMVENVR